MSDFANWDISASPDGHQATLPQSGEQGTGTQSVITREEVQSMLEASNAEVLKRAQGITDKNLTRFEREWKAKLEAINSTIEVQRAAGINITPEQQTHITNTAFNKLIATTPPAENLSPAALPPSGAQAPIRPVNEASALAADIFKAYGLQVTREDPEFITVKATDRATFIRTLTEAVQAKAKRASITPSTRLPTQGTGSAPSLKAAYEAEKSKIPRGQSSLRARIELDKKYRDMGYNPG